MGIFDKVKSAVNQADKKYNPLRKVADAMTKTSDATGAQAAKAAGQAARQAAIERGRVLKTPTGGLKKKKF